MAHVSLVVGVAVVGAVAVVVLERPAALHVVVGRLVAAHHGHVTGTVVARVRAAHFHGGVHEHVDAARARLGVHTAVHLEGHVVHDVLAVVIGHAEPGAVVGHVQGSTRRVALGPVARAGDVAVVARGVLMLVDANVVLDLRHREQRRARSSRHHLLIVVHGMAVGIARVVARAVGGHGVAGRIAGEQVQAEVLLAVLVGLHRVGARAAQQLLDLAALHLELLAVGVGHGDLVHIGGGLAADLNIVGIEVAVGHVLAHVKHHARVVGLRAGVGHAAVVLLPVAGALGGAHAVVLVHLAEVGQQRHLGLVAHIQHVVVLAVGIAAMAPVVAVVGAVVQQREAAARRSRARGAPGVGVVQARAVDGVEVHLRQVHLRDVGTGDRRVLHARLGHFIQRRAAEGLVRRRVQAAQLQQVVLRLARHVLEGLEVLVAEAVEHHVLLVALGRRRRTLVHVHILPGDELHRQQVHDAVRTQRLLADDEIALVVELEDVRGVGRVLEVVGQRLSCGHVAAVEQAVGLIGLDGPGLQAGGIGTGALAVAREHDGAHGAVLEGLEQLLVHRHLGGVETHVVVLLRAVHLGHAARGVLQRHRERHVHIVQTARVRLVVQVGP